MSMQVFNEIVTWAVGIALVIGVIGVIVAVVRNAIRNALSGWLRSIRHLAD